MYGFWGFSLAGLIFLFGFLGFSIFRYYYLLMLLSVELMMLSIYFYLCLSIYFGLGSMDMILLFLVMMVCEGAFGISLLIIISRSEGGDYFNYI